MKDLDYIAECTRDITALAGTQTIKRALEHVDFVVKDQLEDEQAGAQCTAKPDGRIEIAIAKSQIEQGKWHLCYSIAHEMVHATQRRDKQLAPFFNLHGDAMLSAKMNFLFELDAYVKAASIMRDLESKGIVTPPAQSKSLPVQIDVLYRHAEANGYKHDDGSAQQIIFESLLRNEGLARLYILPRLEAELEQLDGTNRAIKTHNIQPGNLMVDNIHIPRDDKETVMCADTVLGKIGAHNFMANKQGTAYLDEPDFFDGVLSPQTLQDVKTLCTLHKQLLDSIQPYIAPPSGSESFVGRAADPGNDIWGK